MVKSKIRLSQFVKFGLSETTTKQEFSGRNSLRNADLDWPPTAYDTIFFLQVRKNSLDIYGVTRGGGLLHINSRL